MLAIFGFLLATTALPPALHEQDFTLESPAEVVAEISAGCEPCDWATRGREAAAVELRLDGRYSQHLFLVRGRVARYEVALGKLDAGAHSLTLVHDQRLSAPRAGKPEIEAIAVQVVDRSSPRGRLLAHAPILWARANTIGRFTDLPLVMWVEDEPAENGSERLRYSVVFSNEDGGTPPDRLMATWGRLTDIEFIYGVELDASGRRLLARYQGPEHRVLSFEGAHEGDHPLLHVVTDNNMVADRGPDTIRIALVPKPFALSGTSREAVMDAEPWTYSVSVREARREGRIDEQARPGSGRLPDPRRFATIEACAATEDATVSFGLGVRGSDGSLRWYWSDGGRPQFRIGRRATEFPNGCFRGAVALPLGTAALGIEAMRFRAFTRIAGKGEPPLPRGSGRAVLGRVNRLFLLDGDDQPAPSSFSWEGEVRLVPDGPPVELTIND